ncbi:MAG: right-handed parallel beta-helix repeat-containing protein [Anaerolineae bacterium]
MIRRWTAFLAALLLVCHIVSREGPRFLMPRAMALGPVIQVTNSADSGPGTLRWALDTVGPGGTIAFDPAAFPPGNPATIQVQSALPPLDDGGVTLDGTGAGVRLDGSLAPPGTVGLNLLSDGNVVRGLVLAGFGGPGVRIAGANNQLQDTHIWGGGGEGVLIEGPNATGNLLLRNSIGTNAGGTPMGNAGCGVLVRGGAHDNLIGLARADANVIGSNGADGVCLEGEGTRGNRVLGNFIGTDRLGHAGLGNRGCGVRLATGAAANQVGDDGLGEGNIVAGNLAGGLCLGGANVHDNEITGNHVGTALSGLTAIPNEGPGIILSEGTTGNTLQQNLISGNAGDGIVLRGSNANFVLGNRIGVNAVGASALANGGAGVLVEGGAAFNVVGRVAEGEENQIAGNAGPGIWLRGEGTQENVVAGNRIGTDFGGFQPLGNGEDGLRLSDGPQGNWILFNQISGNRADGIRLQGPGTNGNRIAGNRVGLDLSGEGPLPNAGHGIHLLDGASGNRIGRQTGLATALGEALWARRAGLTHVSDLEWDNRIAHNAGDGVRVEGRETTGNTLRRNRITANGGMGIRLRDGGNGELPPPQIWEASPDRASGQACSGCWVECFADPEDEGETFLGAVQADAWGNFSFEGVLSGPNLTATATDAQGNTSAFSPPVRVGRKVYLPLGLVDLR